MPKFKRLLLALAALGASLSAHGHDLGVRGKLFPIKEESFIRMVVQRAAHANVQKLQQNLERKAQWDVHHFPQQNLPAAQHTLTTYYSPGIILKKPVRAPVDGPDGYHWHIVYPAGTHVNPLRRGLEPVTRMLFFNENDPKQVRFMHAALKAYPYFILPVAMGGNIPAQAKTIGRPMYYAYPTVLQRFQILATPAFLGVGTGKYRYDMAVTYFGPHALKKGAPYALEIHAAWFGLTGKHQVVILPRAPNTLHGKSSTWPTHEKGVPLTGGSADIYANAAIQEYDAEHHTHFAP